MSDGEEFVLGTLAIAMALLLAGAGIMLGYQIIGTYNERKECQKLGIPLYRCQSNSVQADVKVNQ